ncbi:MAG: ribosomal protein S4e [Candidatus Thermoplasmatota archaeon]|nr:ribosomal protein S4e [Candidatus Thermoplasmatota archaeon]
MKKHMKRMTAPRTWTVPRKTSHWVSKARPGPHGKLDSVPVGTILRDLLKVCDNAREARFILGKRTVLVDGRAVTDPKFPVGLMDVLTLKETKASYRMLIDYKGKLRPVTIDENESGWKLARVDHKTTVRGGKTQVTLHDGRNILLPKDQYETGDVLKIEVPSQRVLKAFKLDKGSLALLTGGSHPGTVQTISSYVVKRGSASNIVLFKEGPSTVKENVFVVGDKVAEIKLLEAKIA